MLNRIPAPMPVPSIFNLDAIQALTNDTVVSENGMCYNLDMYGLQVEQHALVLVIFLAFPQMVSFFPALKFEDLGIAPQKLKGYPVEFLIQYRKGGPNYGSTVSEKYSDRQSWS